MSKVGQIERTTQNRIVRFFLKQLQYDINKKNRIMTANENTKTHNFAKHFI